MPGMAWLAIAIVAEVIATTALKASDGFRNTIPSMITATGYAIAFWGMSQAMPGISRPAFGRSPARRFPGRPR